MEQKKILWVILTITAFVVVIFGIALFLYSPSRSANRAKITQLDTSDLDAPNMASIKTDPDAWTRNESEIPTPSESENQIPVNINNNLTVVTGLDPSEAIGVDVSGLTKDTVKTEGKLPNSIAEDVLPETTKQDSLTNTKKDESSKITQTRKISSGITKVTPKQPVQKPQAPKKNITQKKTSKKQDTKNITKKTTYTNSIPHDIFWVQTASLSSRLYAEEARQVLQNKNMKAEIFTKQTIAGLVHRVRVGPFSNKTEAEYWLKNVKVMDGFESSFISQEKIN